MGVQKILRRREVESVTGMKHPALYDAIAKKKFPKPVRVTERCVGWLESDLLAWQAARIAERDCEKKSSRGRGSLSHEPSRAAKVLPWTEPTSNQRHDGQHVLATPGRKRIPGRERCP